MARRINKYFVTSSLINFIVFGFMFKGIQYNLFTADYAISVIIGLIILKLSLAFLLDFFYDNGYVQDEVLSHTVDMVMMFVMTIL